MSHLKYLWFMVRHKWFVLLECWRLRIRWRGICHDMSKFRPDEWLPYVRYFYQEHPSLHDVPPSLRCWMGRTKEDVDIEFNHAWLKHQHRNDHHWQHWVLREDDGGTKVLCMSYEAALEMVADWRGAGRAIMESDNAAQWYKDNKDNILLHAVTHTWVEKLLGIQ